jgi:hypothetical protein
MMVLDCSRDIETTKSYCDKYFNAVSSPDKWSFWLIRALFGLCKWVLYMQPQSSAQGVSAQYLLEGAVYALEQAGRLLQDAHLLYKNQRYGSAIVMALFAREEIGRYQLIRQLRKKMMETDGVVLAEDIDRACDDHVRKQSLG